MTIRDILDRAKIRGLDGVCITDHDTMNIRYQLSEGVQENGICVLFGMEYTTAQGDFLLFGPFEDLPTDLPTDVLLRTVRKIGGVAVAAHPFRRHRSTTEKVIRSGLCHAVESLNGRNSTTENAAVDKWLARYDLVRCGGSDAHTPHEVGTFATRFFNPVLSRADLIRALKSSMCSAVALGEDDLNMPYPTSAAAGITTFKK
jgi:hypothetical protein